MPFRLRVFAVLFLAAQMVSCGPDENPTECQDHSKDNLTGELAQDIIGVWANCLEYVDTVGPICVFEPGGVLKLVYGIPSKERRDASPDLYEKTGVVETYTYTVEADLGSSEHQVSTSYEGFAWTVTSISKDALFVQGASTPWRHQTCSGYGFD